MGLSEGGLIRGGGLMRCLIKSSVGKEIQSSSKTRRVISIPTRTKMNNNLRLIILKKCPGTTKVTISIVSATFTLSGKYPVGLICRGLIGGEIGYVLPLCITILNTSTLTLHPA